MDAIVQKAYLHAADSETRLYVHGYTYGLAQWLNAGEPDVAGQSPVVLTEHYSFDVRRRAAKLDDFGAGVRDGLVGNPPRGYSRKLGNTNAAKADAKSVTVRMRCLELEQQVFYEAAEKAGMSFSSWAREALYDKLASAGHKPPKGS